MAEPTLQQRVGGPLRGMLLPLLRLLDRVAQRLVPVRRQRVLYASIPDYADNAYPVFRHLLETRRDLEHVWLLRDAAVADRIRADFDRAGAGERGHRLVVRPWGMRSYLDFLRCGHVFHTHGVYGFSPPRRGRVQVCLWHGMPVKAIRRLHRGDHGYYPVHGTFHLATSSFFRYVIAGVFDAHPDDVLVCGLPRTDVLKGKAAPGHDRAAIAAQLDFDPAKRWVLWMPTHRSEPGAVGTAAKRTFVEAVEPSLLDALEDAAASGGAEVIVKLHPFDLLNDEPVDLGREHLRLLTATQWEATGIQLYDLVAASDALITDISSIFIDYLHTGNPIGILGYEAETYTRETLFDPALLLRCRAAHALTSPADIEAFMAGMSKPAVEPSGTGDLSVVFNEDQEIASTAHVVDAVGL